MMNNWKMTAAALCAALGATMTVERASAQEDPFLWLEEVESERALDWVETQNARSLAELQGDERYEPLFQDAREILNSNARIPYGALRNGYVYNFWQDADNPRGLWRRAALKSYLSDNTEWETVLDIDALAEAEEENWVYKGANCLAPDYDLCLVSLSRGGADAAVEREFKISEKAFVEGGFEIPEAKSSVAWVDADTLLVGSDIGENALTTSGYPRVTRIWKRGTPLADAEIVFEGAAEDVGVWPFTDLVGDERIVGVIRATTFFTREQFLRGADGAFEKLPLPPKSSVEGFLPGRLIASLQEEWTYGGETFPTGAVVSLDRENDEAELVFAAGEREAVDAVAVGESVVYVELLDNVVGKLLKLTPKRRGWKTKEMKLPANGVVSIANVADGSDEVFVNFESPTTPDSLYYFSAKGRGEVAKTAPAFFDADGVVVEQREATSKDGTKIPFFVIGKKDVVEAGNAPTVLYGYGGFQVSILPNYSAVTGKLWIEEGGVYVIANIRGGGEFGPDWHQAALKQNRHKAYEDFFAVGDALVASGLTTPQKLGALGGSNGGLLMGVAFTQRPDLFNAIGCGVPLLDMLRYHTLLAGASWMGEYGNPENAEERTYIETYSPYQAIKKEADYPRVFFFTSTRDDRVHPGHARKAAAKFEKYGHPFLYYENTEGGHGAATNPDQRARLSALEYVYFARQLKDD